MDDNCDIPRVDVPAEFSGPGYYNNPSIESADGKEIVGCGEYLVFGPTFKKEERAANVRLLCSAPDLLAALEATEAKLTQAARAFYGAGNAKALREAFEGWRTTAEADRAAIAKATATK